MSLEGLVLSLSILVIVALYVAAPLIGRRLNKAAAEQEAAAKAAAEQEAAAKAAAEQEAAAKAAAEQEAAAKAAAEQEAAAKAAAEQEAEQAKTPIDPAKAEALASEKALVTGLAEGAPNLSGTPNDLMLIEGIGPHYRDILAAAGVDTFAKVAELDEAKFVEIAKAAGSRKHASMATWARQAALAAAGDWAALRTLQDQLMGGQERKRKA